MKSTDKKTKNKDYSMIFIIGFLLISMVIIFNLTIIKTVYTANLPLDDYGVEVSIQDYNGEIVSLFLTRELQLTNLTNNISVMDYIVNVTNTTNCLVGDAVDIFDNNNYFQGIILQVNATSINFTPKIDHNFSLSNTVIKCGEWNFNVDGSNNPVLFYINSPTNKSWDIESIGMQFKDNLDWDINSFGSRTALTNGFVLELGNGEYNSLFLIYNNGGFALRGGIIQNIAKAPAGLYGFNVDLEFATKYGSVLKLDPEDKLRAIVQDDLTSQTEIAFTIRGHYKDS